MYQEPIIGDAPINLKVMTYPSNPRMLKLVIPSVDGKHRHDTVITTGMLNPGPDGKPLKKYQAYIDISRSFSTDLFLNLQRNNIAQPVLNAQGKFHQERLGYGDHPLYQFNPQKLREMDPAGVAMYERCWQMSEQEAEEQVRQQEKPSFLSELMSFFD